MSDKLTGTKLEAMYNDLDKKGYWNSDRANFISKFFARGEEGYKVRKMLYDDLHSKGYLSSPSYEEFMRRIGWDSVANLKKRGARIPSAQTSNPAGASSPSNQQQKQPDSKASGGWSPTNEQMADAFAWGYNMQQSMHDSFRNTNRKLNLITGAADRHDGALSYYRHKAVAAGTPTSVVGIRPQATPKQQPFNGNGPLEIEDNTSTNIFYASPIPYDVVKKNGQDVTQWLLPDGTLTTSYMDASNAEYIASRERLAYQFRQRMRDNGLNPSNRTDVEKQMQLDFEAPARDAAAAAWDDAIKSEQKQNEAISKSVWQDFDPTRCDVKERFQIEVMSRMASHRTNFDMEKMSDKVWRDAGEKMTLKYYYDLKAQNSNFSDSEIHAKAQELAKDACNYVLYNYAVSQNTPKSTLEYFLRNVVSQNTAIQISKGLARVQSGSTGDMDAEEQAREQYGNNHKIAKYSSIVTGMATDPAMYGSGYVAGLFGKVALRIGGSILSKSLFGEAAQIGTRLFGKSAGGRFAQSLVSGAANIGTYEGIKEAENQFVKGGHINRDGVNEGYSLGEILKSAQHGVVMGAATGALSPIIGNVADKWVKATSSTAGKIGVRFGEQAISSLAEGTVFAIPEWIENSKLDNNTGKKSAFDIWSDSMAMMLGFKVSHLVKSAPRVINELRTVKNPRTAEDHFKNRISFEERVRNYLDKSASDYVFSKDEISELRAFGYGKLSDLFRRKKQSAKEVSDNAERKNSTEVSEGYKPLNDDISDTATERYRSREFDGYEALERLVNDKNVSQSTRAKAYYVLTGRELPMGTVMSYNATKLADGTLDITASTIHGDVVRRWYTKSEKEGKRIFNVIHRQIELNNLDYLERMRAVKAQAFAFKQVINEVAPNADANTIANVYIKAKSGGKEYMEAYGDLVNKIDNGLKEKALEIYNNSPEAIRHEIFKDSGINVDDAIRKSPDKRTEEEKKAVESYFRLLKEKIEETDPHANETVSNNPRLESDNVRSRVNANESYAKNAKEERQDVKMDFDVKRERAISLEPELESLERDGSLEYYDEIKPDATPEQKQAVRDYAEAKARYDAMLEPLKQRFEEQKEKAESYVDGITNPEDGNVTHVRLKGWNGDYFVISGKIDVIKGENDEIISWNSVSDCLVVTDKDGEKRMISLKDIDEVVSQQPAEQLKSDLIQKIEQDENALYGEIDGNLSLENGSKFSIINPEGRVQDVEIRIGEQGQREAVIDEGDGHISVVPLDENVANKLREMELAYRKYRYDSKTSESDSEPNEGQNGAIEDDSDIFFGQSEKGNTSSEDLSLLVNDAMRNFEEVFGEEAEERMYEANEHPEDLLNDQNLTDEQRDAVTKYLEAKKLLEESLSGENNDDSKMPESENAIHHPMTEEELERQSAKEAYDQALQGNMQRKNVPTLSEEQAKGIQDHNSKMLEEQKKQKEMENNRKPSAMSLIPVDYKTKEPMFEKAYPNAALDAIDELTGGNEENTRAIVNAQVEQASKEVEALKKKAPTKKPATLEGSPMQMAKAQQNADAEFNAAMDKYNADVAAAKQKLDAWTRIASIMNERDKRSKTDEHAKNYPSSKADEKGKKPEEDKDNGVNDVNDADNETVESENKEEEPPVIGHSTRWGKIYQWTTGRFKEAVDFLTKSKGGILKGVFHRDDIGDISIGWGEAPNNYNGRGLAHIIKKHINVMHDFNSIEDMVRTIENIIENGKLNKNKDGNYELEDDSYRVVIVNDEDGNWILSAFDYIHSKKEKLRRKDTAAIETPSQSNVESGAVNSNLSTDKVTESAEPVQTSEEKSYPEAKKKAGETADEKSDVLPPRPEASEGKNTDESQESASDERADERADESEQKQTEASNATAKEAESETDGKKVDYNISSEEPASPFSKEEVSAYTIEPSTYTNKKGKTSDVSLLKFSSELTAEQERAVKEFAKERMGEGRFAPARGWKDRESGGWIFRNEEDARKAAEMVGNEEAVADAQPMTVQELRDAVEPKQEKYNRTAKQPKPANKVESVPAAEPAKEENPQYEVSDEELGGLLNDIRDILGIGDDEGDAGFHFRDPDELTAEQRQKLMSVGQRAAMAFVERGNESFADYATMMVKALGDKVRPWLKAFYGGLEYIPGYDKYALTPYEEVKAFDVENFDKAKKNMLSKADMMAEEGKAQKVADKANNELKTKRNERRKKDNEQKSADTAAVAEKAGAAASEAESVAKSSKDRQEISEASGKLDDELEDVDNQLALLGYYESDGNDMADAEKKAVNNAADLAKSIINDLGLDLYAATHEDSLHGGINKKKPLAVADIGDKYGSIRINIPLGDGRLLNIELTAERTIDEKSDNSAIKIDAISVSVMKGSDSFGHVEESREFFADGVKYKDLLESIQRQTYKYIERQGEAVEGLYHSGDKVQYSPDGGKTWHDAIVVQPNDEGGVRIDTGQAPVMYVNAHLDQLRHKAVEQPKTISNAEIVNRVIKHPLFKKLVDNNPDPEGARSAIDRIMNDVRKTIRTDEYLDIYKRLVTDKDFVRKIGDEAFARRKIEGNGVSPEAERSSNESSVDKAVADAKAAMKAKLEQIKDKLDAKLLNEQIDKREKYMIELADRVKAGETIGTFARTKNVDLQATLLRCIGERDALKEALNHLPAKPSAESIADNPQSWVGRIFTYGNTRLVCKEVEGNYATFDNQDTFINIGFEVDKVQKDIKSGKCIVEGATPVNVPKDEDIFQKAERIANEDKVKRDKAKAAAEVGASNIPVPAKENKTKPGTKEPTKEVKPEDPVGEIFSRDEEKKDDASEGKTEIHRTFAEAVKNDMLASLESGTKPYRGIVDLRKRARALGMDVDDEGRTDILLQELVEDGLVRAAREVIAQNKSGGRYSVNAYEQICKLYEMQPTITARSSNRIKMQQYSTPLPMSFNAARFAMRGKLNGMVLEPTAGNGMLVFAIPSKQVHVNELDGTRLGNLREQGFALVTQQDATQPFEGGKKYDVVICNPPFGKLKAANYDGKMIGGLDPQIALNALASMKDDGRAAIIIGGNMEYAVNGGIKSMKPFFTYLYDHYNVKGVVDMDGKLYAKQGTTFPTRMILIDGRRSEEERAQSAVYPPVKDKAIRKAESFEDLFRIVDEIINSKEKTNGTEVLRSQQGQLAPVGDTPSRRTDREGHREQPRTNDEDGRRGTGAGTKPASTASGSQPVLSRERGANTGNGEARREPAGDAAGRTGGNTEPAVQRVGGDRVSTDGVGLAPTASAISTVHAEPKKRELTDEKSAYRPHNTAYSLKSVSPAAMVEAMDHVLTQIEKEHGSIDNFVTTELGYDSVEDAHHALAAEQMDSVAMAVYQMKHGQALIIGDQTGVGKGRQMAALIRWAVKRGEKPVFITQKADLFSDIYRDLVDVGSGDLVPFIFNSDGAMVDSNGKTVHKPLSQKEQAKVFASGKLPDKYDFAVLTYSQVNTGDEISQKELKEAAKQSGARVKKSKSADKPTPKATFLRAIAKDNYLFLDESHTAAGTSNTGAYLQSILRSARAATFASATFAKRPDTMPLYAIRTAMSQANVEPNKMISIIEKGGVTLQEIMSRELTNAGQMVRRERDMSDVRTDWKTIDDAATVKRARENYDKTIAAFNAIIKFQEDYVKPLINILSGNFAMMAGSADVKRGTDKMGVDNTPFANKTYNYTKQLMLALKVDAIADEVEKEINAGRHPVIALESTMESSIKDNYAAGDTIDEPTFSASLLKGLDSVMQYTINDEDGNKLNLRFSPSELGKEGEKAYYDLQNLIRESTSDIFISPLDAIIDRLHEKGYKVGELTGRSLYVERGDDGKVVVKRRTDKDKKRMQREFNNGQLDVLILNKSASTGISLHASEKFSDQRQRSMIIAQPLSDINDYMQMIGRIDRTGQVHRGYYINLGLPVPAENRFLMMLSTKLKSLNANTTTSQDSESNEVDAPDLLNKYGSQVVVEYLRDNPEIYEKMGAPLKKSGLNGGKVTTNDLDEYKAQEDDARKITGHVALLSTKEQEDFYDDVVRRYNELIKYLNDTGNNDLKITVMPLRAKTLEKKVSSPGNDPNGSNPFARDSYVEKVEMDVLRKPMKADEVRKTIELVNKGKSPEDYLRQVVSIINAEDAARLEAENERYEKDKQSAQESIAKQTEKINAQKKRTAEEKTKAITDYTEEKNAATEAKHNQNVYRIKANSQMLKHSLTQFEVGKSYLMPDNLEDPVFDFASPAIFCGYKTKDRKITASTTLAVFATLDGRRRVEVKLSRMGALQSILKMTNDNWDSARSITLENWDNQIPTETRKEGYIMTGNILQAIADTRGERGGYPGQLISYTDMDGNVHDGILMPDRWNPTMLKSSGAPIISRMQQIMNYEPVKSSDGNVEITGSALAHTYYLTVPRSKKDGAKFFENPTLLRAAVGSNFFPYHGKLRADIVGKDDIETVVKELSKLGVRVQDEKSATDNGRKFRLLDDDDPKVKELEALPEGELVPVYRNVQAFGDDALGSPMAFFDAETGERRTLQGRRWNYSEAPEVELTDEQQRKLDELNRNGYIMVDGKETTELPINDGLKFVKPKTKEAQLQYLLKKNPEDSGTWAAYDPYDHAIETPLNTQFAEAYKRPNLVVVRSFIPKSEITEPFHADYALLPTGAHQWNNGRTLYLSRWSKIDKVLTREEEAKLIDEYWKKNPGKREALKTHRDYNRFVPEVRKELEKMGYRFEYDGKVLTPEESLALDQQREADIIPGREGHLPYITGEDIERINAKMSGKWVGEPKEAMENEMAARVEDLSEKLHTPVRIIRTDEEVAALPTPRQRRQKGSFNTMTGEVTIVVPNNANLADVENTFMHEVVGHDGLRVLFPDEEKLNNALDELYRVSNDSIKHTIDRMAQKMYDAEVDRLREQKRKAHEAKGEDVNASYDADMAEARAEAESKRDKFRRDATEEYGADLAGRIGESGFEKMSADELTFWGKLKATLQKALQKLLDGLKILNKRKWSDKEWAFVLHEAYKRKKNGGRPTVFDAADTVVMKRKTGFDDGRMFRDGDMGLDETITKMKLDAAAANADSWKERQEAIKAIGGNLENLRKAMSYQRNYDLTTVKSITDLAKLMLDHGLLDDLSKYETKRILSTVNNAHGKKDVSDQVQKIMDIMVDNQIRLNANEFGKMLATRGKNVNGRGIEVQGELDADGQTIVQTIRRARNLDRDDINMRIADALDRMGSEDSAIANEAELEYNGLIIAFQYAEDIKGSKEEESDLRKELKEAYKEVKAGNMSEKDFVELKEATDEAIRENKIERAEHYREIVNRVGGILGESAERALAWRKSEKKRVRDIQHNANSDMEGSPSYEHHKEDKLQKLANNDVVRIFLAPLGTFDQMLRMFGSKSVNGEGYLWNRYMRGWVDATEKEYTGYQKALKILDEKVSDVFGKKMKWGDLFALDRKLPKATVTFRDGGEMKAHELAQGNLLYIYMVDKMVDGRMKLRRMGITEEDVENIKDFVDTRLLELADWIQDEFLVEKRNEYNEVHKRMFGASMAAIEKYFPLKILANARTEDVDVADETTDTILPATSTGSIIKRRRNTLALDVMGADAFSVVLDHIQQMERWASFAELNRDLNALLSYKRFRNQVMNMTSVYGGGKTLWNNFRNVCSMAAGTYRPPVALLDRSAVNIAKGVTAAKISLRMFTALKQFLSMPAYLSDSNPIYLASNLVNPIGAWKWSIENLPIFEKRWKSRIAGDPRLMKSEKDWTMWRSNVAKIASRFGMLPNAFVDALTVAIGAHSMYQTRKQKYLRYGYDEATADKRAKQDATILFNQTQQSSEGAFLSTMQVDRSWLSVLFTVFRNSSMSYTRQLYDAMRNLKRRFGQGYKNLSIEFMSKQMQRDGIERSKAEENARHEYSKALAHDIARMAVFGFILQFAWNLGAYLPYILLGRDDDKKDGFISDAAYHAIFGGAEGLTGGDVISNISGGLVQGKSPKDIGKDMLNKEMPLTTEMRNFWHHFGENNIAAANDCINILSQSAIGVNPETITNMLAAIYQYCGDDPKTDRECALLIARVMNVPQSQLDEIYFDELGVNARDASKMTPAQIAERYAKYKSDQEAGVLGFAYNLDDDAYKNAMERHRKKAESEAKSRLEKSVNTDDVNKLIDEYDAFSKQRRVINKLKREDVVAYRDGMQRLHAGNDIALMHRTKRYKHDMKVLEDKYLKTKNIQERNELLLTMQNTKRKYMQDVANMNQK